MTDPTTRQILERVTRIETRLTKYLVAQGHETEAQKPMFNRNSGFMVLPSAHTSLSEILTAIPEDYHGSVDIYLGNTKLASLTP